MRHVVPHHPRAMAKEERIYSMLLRGLAFGFVLGLVLPAGAASSVPAATTPAFGSTALELYHVCGEAKPESEIVCQSFLAGIWEASRIIAVGQHMRGDRWPSLCTASVSAIPVRELVSIYNRWVEGHPNNLDGAAGAAAMIAFGDAFTCPSESSRRPQTGGS